MFTPVGSPSAAEQDDRIETSTPPTSKLKQRATAGSETTPPTKPQRQPLAPSRASRSLRRWLVLSKMQRRRLCSRCLRTVRLKFRQTCRGYATGTSRCGKPGWPPPPVAQPRGGAAALVVQLRPYLQENSSLRRGSICYPQENALAGGDSIVCNSANVPLRRDRRCNVHWHSMTLLLARQGFPDCFLLRLPTQG